MKLTQDCPLCQCSSLRTLHSQTFTYPGDDIKSNLLDAGYVRRWILFSHILKESTPIQFAIVICQNCGFIFLNPRLEEKDMEIKYNLIDQLGSVKARLAAAPPPNPDRRAAIIYRQIAKANKNRVSNLQVLDFGGASGANLSLFTKDNECYVVDYEKWELPKGVSYLCRTADEIPEGMNFDIISCCHVLEHLTDPAKTVSILASHLGAGGLIYVEVPLEYYSYDFRHMSDPLTHINFFSSASLSYLLSSCGLRVKSACGSFRWLIRNRSFWLSMVGEKDKVEETSKSLVGLRDVKVIPRAPDGYRATLRQMRMDSILRHLLLEYVRYLLLAYDKARGWARRVLLQSRVSGDQG